MVTECLGACSKHKVSINLDDHPLEPNSIHSLVASFVVDGVVVANRDISFCTASPDIQYIHALQKRMGC